jgi:MFS family permease
MPDPSIQRPPTPTAITTTPAAAPDPSPDGAAPRSALLIVFLVVFIDLLGFGIVLPQLPRYGDQYVEALFPGGKENATGGAILGLLMASFSAMQFLFAPVWGRVSDHVGRRPILLLGLGGSVVFYCLFGYASDLPTQQAGLALVLLYVARLGAGIAGATISTAQAVIADCTAPERRKHGMALIGAAFGIGFTFGPLIGAGALALFPEHLGVIGYVAAALSLVALVLGTILLPETRRFRPGATARKWLEWKGLLYALRTPAIAPVILTFFLATLGFGAFETTLALLNRDALGVDERQSYLVFAYVGFVLMLTQGFLYRRLANRLSEVTFMTIGICLMAVGVLSLAGVSWVALHELADFPVRLAWMLVSLTLCVVGFAFLTPSAQALVSRRTDPTHQGEVLGVNQSASAMARILGPIFGLTLYKLTPSHMLPYAFGAALLVLMLPLIPRMRRA